MLGSLLCSLCLMRLFLGRWFILSHRIMTISGLAAMFWHVLRQSQLEARVIVGISGGIWILFTTYRLYRLFGRRLSAEIVDICGDSSTLKIEVVLRRPVKITPGKYFNIFFPGTLMPYALMHSYSAVAFWHPPDETHPCRRISNVSFLLSRQGSHVVALSNLQRGQRILLEGPFGKGLKLHTFENVILAAKGIGIAGVLPLALELAERRRHDDNLKSEIQSVSRELDEMQRTSSGTLDQRVELQKRKSSLLRQPLFRDATKKVDLFWSLENNTQMDVIQAELHSLQRLDPDNVS